MKRAEPTDEFMYAASLLCARIALIRYKAALKRWVSLFYISDEGELKTPTDEASAETSRDLKKYKEEMDYYLSECKKYMEESND